MPTRHAKPVRVSVRYILIGVLPSAVFLGMMLVLGRALRNTGARNDTLFGLLLFSASVSIVVSLITALHAERRERSATSSADLSVVLALWVTIAGLNALLSFGVGMCCFSLAFF